MYTPPLTKRVYEAVTVTAADTGHGVALDGRVLRTPARSEFRVPTEALASAVAAEWSAQQERIEPKSMPMTALACTALDLIVPRRSEVVAELAGYGGSDALCYQVERPDALVERQEAVWRPLLDWAAAELGAPLRITTGMMAADQPDEALAALRRSVEDHDDFALCALSTAVKAAGSLVVGLALSRGRLDAEGAFGAGELHETYQIEQWGEDPEATRRRDSVRADLAAAERFLAILRDG
ncbi:MAG: ATP12 family protein [Kiloniellales bacterium]|nr:ATP12 family protein [Kiloniellales bacterium]